MAPSPENDNAPKAPDKTKTTSNETSVCCANETEKDNNEKSLSNLNDGELRALLDEAINYKNPKDREGKSKLFKVLLSEAEETERIARAASAGGSELVRHCNPSAKRHGRHRRKPSSISENMMHGGSLDNLANDELYDADRHLQRTRKSVSARQREGGSLPCNVNTGIIQTECYFLEEARCKKAKNLKPEYTAIDMESQSLLEHDSLAQNYRGDPPEPIEVVQNATKYTTKALFQVGSCENDALAQVQEFDCDYGGDLIQSKLPQNKHSLYIAIPNSRGLVNDKKVDENGNHQSSGVKTKKKERKVPSTKKETVLQARDVVGHRSDIIDDITKLVQYIGGSSPDANNSSGKSRSNVQKSKLCKQDTEDGCRSGKKHRAHSSKSKEPRSELKKSNSMGEISTKTNEFDDGFANNKDNDKVLLRSNKNVGDRPRERRSWGNVEPPPFQSLYNNASAENLEMRDDWVVTKPKKKSKKRRNSISSSRPQNSTSESNVKHKIHNNRAPSPDLRGKSVPHSEKSNDSSDVDSVHSLPIDSLNIPISYADIAKNAAAEKKLIVPNIIDQKSSPTSNNNNNNKSSLSPIELDLKVVKNKKMDLNNSKSVVINNLSPPSVVNNTVVVFNNNNNNNHNNNNNNNNNVKNLPPDVHNIKSFPAISNTNNKASVQVNLNKANNTTTTNNINKNNSVVSNKVKNNSPNSRSVKNNVQKIHNDIQTDLSIIQANEKDSIQFNAQMLPPDIPDVQTIEKMHFMNHHHNLHSHNAAAAAAVPLCTKSAAVGQQQQTMNSTTTSVNCDNSDRTNLDERPPPVVILSGMGNKEVSGLVFGFDINEQLLSEDICENFIARYAAPEVFNQSSHNHDKIVNFVGAAWENVINQSNGKVQYYTNEL